MRTNKYGSKICQWCKKEEVCATSYRYCEACYEKDRHPPETTYQKVIDNFRLLKKKTQVEIEP